MKQYGIAVIPGDGIGVEVMPEGLRVLDAAASRFGFELKCEHFDWSCETWHKTGRMMPEDGIEQLRGFDAIYLGAVGFPGVPDHVSLWGLLIPLRRVFDGVRCPLAGRGPGDIDFWIVRENNEGEYSEAGGRLYRGSDDELVIQESIFTRRGTDRILRYAFDLAASRPAKHLTSATKSNGIIHSMPFWDERFEALAADYPQVRTDKFHVDILTAHFVLHPDWFDVVVGSNLFGDILSDLGPAVAGTIGIAPSANLNPAREYPSMFEPVHGSAPDIAGQGIANPIGMIWSGAMMLEHLGEPAAARAVEGRQRPAHARHGRQRRHRGTGTGHRRVDLSPRRGLDSGRAAAGRIGPPADRGRTAFAGTRDAAVPFCIVTGFSARPPIPRRLPAAASPVRIRHRVTRDG